VAAGRLHVRSRLTRNEAETSFVVVHYGGLDFHTVLRHPRSAEEYEAFKRQLFATFAGGSLADVTELVVHQFPGDTHRLDDLFTEERRRIIGIVLQERFEDYEHAFARLADQDDAVISILARLHYPVPKPMRAAATVALDRRLREELDRLDQGGGLDGIRALAERARAWDYQPSEPQALGRLLERQLEAVLCAIDAGTDFPETVARVDNILDAAALWGLPLDLWQSQNQLFRAYAELLDAGALAPSAKEALAHLADRLRISPGLLGWRP
jgi:hypothetical protein